MNNDLDSVLSQAAVLIDPSKEEEKSTDSLAHALLKKVRSVCDFREVKAECILGGSVAKNTWLKSEADVDIFVRFPRTSPDEVLKEVGVPIGFDALKDLKPNLRYAEHPYVEGFYKTVRVNIVPCFDTLKGEWRSAADRSLQHTDLINKSYNAKLRTNARLLKVFLKNLGLYGAEVKIQGFSGYVAEILILKFGSFKNLLVAASDFKKGELISLETISRKHLESHKSPLVILDPVDLKRNLGAAISNYNVALFVIASRFFLQKPSLNYFNTIMPAYKTRPVNSLINQVIVVFFSYKTRSPDILWGQLRRSVNRLRKQIESMGFKVLRYRCSSDEISTGAFLFFVEQLTLNTKSVKVGPFYHLHPDCDKFLSLNVKKVDLLCPI